MPTPDEDDLEGKTEPEGTPPAKPTPPPTKTTDWEGAYKGLQRQYEKLQERHKELQAKYDQLTEDAEGTKLSVKQVEGNLKGLNDQLASKDAEIKRLQGELAAQGKRSERQKLIMAEFPELAEFEGEDILPDAEDMDKLREKLTKFRDKLGNTVQGKVADKLKGAGAKSTSKAPPPDLDEDQIYDRMVAIAGSSDPELQAEYAKLQRQWDALHNS